MIWCTKNLCFSVDNDGTIRTRNLWCNKVHYYLLMSIVCVGECLFLTFFFTFLTMFLPQSAQQNPPKGKRRLCQLYFNINGRDFGRTETMLKLTLICLMKLFFLISSRLHCRLPHLLEHPHANPDYRRTWSSCCSCWIEHRWRHR